MFCRSFDCRSDSHTNTRCGRYTGRHDETGGNLSTGRDFGLLSLSRLYAHMTVLRGHENVSFACIFKHCSLKTSDFKLLKCNQQRKRTHF